MARKTVSTIAIKITATATELKRALGRASDRVAHFSKQVKTSRLRLGGFGKAAGMLTRQLTGLTGASGATAAAMMKLGPAVALVAPLLIGLGKAASEAAKSLTRLDEALKLGREINATNVELKALRKAAIDSGNAATDMDQALRKLQQRIGDALVEPSSKTAKAFDEMGTSAEELSKLGGAAAFERVSMAIDGMGSSADKARLANAIFEETGIRLLGTMREVANRGLDPLVNKMIEAGAITDEQAKKVEEVNAAWANAAAQWAIVGDKVVTFFGNALMAVARFSEWAARRFAGAADSFERLFVALGLRTKRTTELTHAEERAAMAQKAAAQSLSEYHAEMRAAEEAAKRLKEEEEARAKKLEELTNKAGALIDSLLTPMERLNKEAAEMGELFRRGLVPLEFQARAMAALAKRTEEAMRAEKKRKDIGPVIASAGAFETGTAAALAQRTSAANAAARAAADAARDRRELVTRAKRRDELLVDILRAVEADAAEPPVTVRKVEIAGI